MDWPAIDFLQKLDPVGITLICCFLIILLVRFLFDIITLSTLIYGKKKQLQRDNSLISVIMAVRNEETGLKENLPSILGLEDTNYEVIVIDDFSQDQSLTILGLLRKDNKRLKFSSLNQEARYSAKLARNVAMKAAAGEWTLALNPLCNVNGDSWIKGFRENVHKGTEAVIGYYTFKKEKGFYNLLSRLELFFQQLNSFVFIKIGLGYVVNEANVMFATKKYFELGGFKGEMSEEYANLELLANKFIQKKKAEIILSPTVKVVDSGHVGRKSFFELLTKSTRIKRKLTFFKRVVLAINDTSKFLLPLLFFVVAFLYPVLLIPVFSLIGIKIILHMFIVISVLKHLNEQKIFIPSLLYELLMPYFLAFSRLINRLPFKG